MRMVLKMLFFLKIVISWTFLSQHKNNSGAHVGPIEKGSGKFSDSKCDFFEDIQPFFCALLNIVTVCKIQFFFQKFSFQS